MNERIKQLWDQTRTSGIHPEFGEYDKYSAEKFAELIVRECCDWIEGSPTSESGCQLLLTKSFIIANLKGLFGV